MHNCIFCNKNFSNKGGLVTHEPYCSLNPHRKIRPRSPNAGLKKGHVPWNKGKSGLYTNEHLEKLRLSGKKSKGIAADPDKELERKTKISNKMKFYGGYRQGSGRGKKGWYKGFFCDSSWELAYILYCLDHSISIKRNTERLKYFFNNKEKSYLPDFIVDGVLTEIKGYRSPQWEAKLKYNPSVNVLYKKDMIPILEYVVLTYGKDYIGLYEQTSETARLVEETVLKTAGG